MKGILPHHYSLIDNFGHQCSPSIVVVVVNFGHRSRTIYLIYIHISPNVIIVLNLTQY